MFVEWQNFYPKIQRRSRGFLVKDNELKLNLASPNVSS
jgi:hypothetical protein